MWARCGFGHIAIRLQSGFPDTAGDGRQSADPAAAEKCRASRRSCAYSERVWVRVLYFGVLRDAFGVSEEAVELPGEATVGGLLRILRGRTSKPSMDKIAGNGIDEGLWGSLAVAVNREYSSPAAVLHEGDEIALLPPVSGGCFAEGGRLSSFARGWAKSSRRCERRADGG